MKKLLDISIRITLNTGVGLILWIACFFGLLGMVQHSPAVERCFPVALAGLTGAFISFLLKRDSNNKIAADITKAGICPKNNGPSTQTD